MTIPINPSRSDFDPVLDISKRRMVVDGHRIAARIASWDNIHVGIPGAGKMPKKVNVDAAHIGVTTLDDGSDLPTAVLPLHTTHAPVNTSTAHAAAWYEDSGKRVARVRYSVDEHGIRADGVLFPDVSDIDVTHLKAGAPSGDWRFASLIRSPDDMEHHPADFAGAAIVNIAGFSDTYSNFAGRPIRLAASGDGAMIFTEEKNMAGECDGSCETCTCGKKGAVTAAAVTPEIAVTDEAVNEQVAENEDPSEMGHDPQESDDDSGEAGEDSVENRVDALSLRVAELEAIIAQLIMAY